MKNNRITELFKIDYPIIQAGMVWAGSYKLASAVSNCGGLGIIGAGSMKPDLLKGHIQKCKRNTSFPFGVNIPLLREDAEQLIKTTIDEGVKIVFTSAGSPAKFIDVLKKNNIVVVHVVSSLKFGLKSQQVGCDAVVGEGVEAGGHNGAEQLSVFSLIPILSENLSIPVIAAGGIATGSQILSSLALGAEGVQIGTRFAVTQESSAHQNYKEAVIKAGENDTTLIFKNIGLVRLIKNQFSTLVDEAEKRGASKEELLELLGKKREMKGIFEGDINDGMLEAGQSAALIKDIPTVKELFNRLLSEYEEAKKRI